MDVDAYADQTLPSGLAVAPDGERAAFLATEFDAEADERRTSLFVVPTDGSAEPYRLTRASDAGNPKWSPDGERLAFVAARDEDAALAVQNEQRNGDDEGGDEGDDESGDDGTAEDGPTSQVWVFDLSRGGDARQATEFERGVSDFDWSPDGDRLAVAARDPTDEQEAYLEQLEDDGPIEVERLQHKFDGTGWLDSVRTYLFVVDPETREAERLDEAYDNPNGADGTGLQPAWGEPGIAFCSRRAFEAPDDTAALDVFTVAPDGTDLERVTDGELLANTPTWSPGGDLWFVGRPAANVYHPTELHVADDAGVRSVSSELDRPLSWFARPQWIDGVPHAAVGDEGATVVYRFPEAGPERVALGPDLANVRFFDAADGRAVVSLTHPSEGHDFHAYDDLDGEGTRLTALNDDLLADVSLDAEYVSWESEGTEIEGVLYTPDDEPEALPLVVYPHGGPVAYDDPEYRFDVAHWTSEGYAVLRPNYRGSSTYGREFSECIRGDWGPRETADIAAGVEALVDRGVADADRVFATGFSYGGMATAYLLTRTDLFAAGAAEHGVYDYRSAYGTDDSHVWWADDFGVPWENPDAYDRASPLTDVDGLTDPLLVTAGDEDWRCPPSQAEQLYVSAKKRGVDARLVVYRGEHHDIGSPERAERRIEELDDWFARYDPDG